MTQTERRPPMLAGHWRRVMLAIPAILFGGLGLLAVLSALAPTSDRRYTGTVADWPLFFNHHNFGGVCRDTQTCTIDYNHFQFGNERPTLPRSSLSPERYDAVMTAGYGPVARTTAPAQLTWTSKDGSTHTASVDIAEIFKDKLIRHHVRREDIPEKISIGSTHIIVEIDNRTVNVYTRTMIPLKTLTDPANRYSSFRSDLIKVHSQTY